MATVFQDGTVWAKSLLDMINDSLLSIGEIPLVDGTDISTLQLGTDAETAKRIIQDTMIEVQARGWYFNTDYNFTLVPDSNKFITMPPNALKADFGATSDRHRYTVKGGKVYDNKEQTFIIEKKLEADVIWLVDYNELPPEAYTYISLRAARKFQQKVLGSTEVAQFTMLDEQDALIHLQNLHLQLQDYNLVDARVTTRTSNYLLTNTLYRTKTRRNF